MAKRKSHKRINYRPYIGLFIISCIMVAGGLTIKFTSSNGNEITITKTESSIKISDEQIPAYITDDRGNYEEVTEYNGIDIPTVDEVDGGLFEDINTGLSTAEGEYEDLGWAETYNVSSPEAFRNDTFNKCIYANNKYGAQCVSLARVFWWSYANRDVSTCGTGMAKGMMNCATQNAGDDFLVFWGSNGIQDGDWIISDGGQFGHVGMALAPVVNGYVALLGENQGGRSCDGGGAATNIINFNVKNVIGYYRPKAYIKPVPVPSVPSCKVRTVKEGETLGSIMKECEGDIKWGDTMNSYANDWVSTKTGQTIFYGWTHGTGYGLFANDTIEYKGV